MSAAEQPQKIVVVRGEKREKDGFEFNLDLEPLVLPGIIVGGLVFVAVYKDQIVEVIDKLSSGLDIKLPIPKPGGDGDGTIPLPKPKPQPGDGGGSTISGTKDSNGIVIPYKMTGKNVNMNYGSRHPNGDRYNANHSFQNYYVVGYYLTVGGSGKRLIEMKTDGPNHSGCFSLPKCEWVELDFDISNGQPYISSEYPHPQNHPAVTQGVTINKPSGTFTNKYVGFGVAAWTGSDGYRVYEEWIDPGGLKANKWVRTLHAKNTGQIIPNPKRQLPTSGRGLEAEIRMNNQHNTQMKFGTIHEISVPSTSAFAHSYSYAFLGERFSNV